MGYIDYLNAFNRWREKNAPSDKAIVLYIGLLDLFNQRWWPEWAGIDRPCLLMLARTSEKRVAHRARDELAGAGLIEYRPFGIKGRATEYRLLEIGVEKSSPNPPRKTSPNLPPYPTPPNKIKNKTKTFSCGDGGAAPMSDAVAAVGECLLARDIDKSLYFGMTGTVWEEARQITEELFSRFGWGVPGEVDISKVFEYTCHREGVREETQITFPPKRTELLTYVFEQAALGGKARNWHYIDGVMRKLAQRGIDTVEKAEEFDYERGGGHG